MSMNNNHRISVQPDARGLFTCRLYAGQAGSGKSVTIGRDINTLLDAEREYRVIDISLVSWYDRQALADEYGTFGSMADVGDESLDLRAGLRETPYIRLDAERAGFPEADLTARHALEYALPAARQADYPTVIVMDNLARSIEPEYLGEAVEGSRSDDVALWVSEQDPFAASNGLAETWVAAGGEIVLHSRLKPPSDRKLRLSDFEEEYVATVATELVGENQVLAGKPGDWRKETVELDERYK